MGLLRDGDFQVIVPGERAAGRDGRVVVDGRGGRGGIVEGNVLEVADV